MGRCFIACFEGREKACEIHFDTTAAPKEPLEPWHRKGAATKANRPITRVAERLPRKAQGTRRRGVKAPMDDHQRAANPVAARSVGAVETRALPPWEPSAAARCCLPVW